MQIVKLPKESLDKFMGSLSKFGEIHAPIKKDENTYLFSKIEDLSKIELDYNRTILPPKKYFFSPTETIFRFSPEKGYEPPEDNLNKKYVLLGVHPCDIHGLKILDLVFSGRYVDNYYFTKRKRTSIIGVSCIPDDKCFCRSMETDFVEDGFDLFLSDIDDSYLVRIATSLGDDMVRANQFLFKEVDKEDIAEYKRKSNERKNHFKIDLELYNLPEIMDLEYENKIWEEIGEKCLSCGTCSMVCPTCYCYDVFDDLDLDGKTGERRRRWDSCLFKDYALVAGGLNFRPERSARVKNRYFHKQRGFVAQYGRPSCVGCGRCVQSCPAKIDIVEVITKIRSVSYE